VDGVHETDPDLFYIELAPGDRLLLCSDGASGVLDQDRLADILSTGSVDYAVVEVVRASLDAGSSDNVTCVVADVVEAADVHAVEGPAGSDPAYAADDGEPLIVGAAAERLPRSGQSSKSFFRGHRGGDTGEIDPVPGADGDPRSADPEELRYAPQAPRRGRGLRVLVGLLVLALILGGIGWLAYRWSQDQFYVAESAGRVAIFQGVQADVPGISLNHVAEDTDITVEALPDYQTEQLAEGIPAESLSAARSIVGRLTRAARSCPEPVVEASPSPTAPSASPTGAASPTPTPTPTVTPTPAPTPSPTLAPPDCIEATS